jgi:4a-hydroxytetrahydrobiopterin dehydratase
MTYAELLAAHCQPRKGAAHAIDAKRAQAFLGELPEWRLADTGDVIEKEFRFENFYQTIEFVNAIAWFANREDHHPDLVVSYNRCHVRWSTHDVGGLSLNDFICAAKVQALLD